MKIDDFQRFRFRLQDEYERATSGHAAMNSAHEGYAVILEELDEFWQEVKKKRSERSQEAMLDELVQIAAMAMRTAVDLRLLPPASAEQLTDRHRWALDVRATAAGMQRADQEAWESPFD